MTKDELIELAQVGMGIHSPNAPEYIVCAALIEALAQPEQEPSLDCTRVACMGNNGCIGNCWNKDTAPPQQELVCVCGAVWEGQELIYTTPQRKPLTDEELFKLWVSVPAETEDRFAFARAIEAAHGIKGEA